MRLSRSCTSRPRVPDQLEHALQQHLVGIEELERMFCGDAGCAGELLPRLGECLPVQVPRHGDEEQRRHQQCEGGDPAQSRERTYRGERRRCGCRHVTRNV